jgi:hypothetical protein
MRLAMVRRPTRVVGLVALCVWLALAADAPALAARDAHGTLASADLQALLQKAGQYVVAYEGTFTMLVAEEAYEQQTREPENGMRRHLRSDIVFVTLAWPSPWGVVFRDVFEVDGQKVRDRESRLEQLLLRGEASSLAAARALRDESARYNIGLYRDINEPTVPLLILHPENQPRFHFELRGQRRFPGAEGREVAFEELSRPTVILWDRRDDLPVRGRFWLEPRTGTVLRSELAFDLPYEAGINYVRTGRITVEYKRETGLGMWVPAEMKEDYPNLLARARYTHYRRMSVETQEFVHHPRKE